MIKIKDLTFSYDSQKNPALRDINLQVEKGQICVVFGASGSGKSTLLKLLKKELRPMGNLDGLIEFDRETICGYVGQSPDNQIVTSKVWQELAFGLENMGLKRQVIHRKVAEISEYFGIADWFFRETDSLSGGNKQLLNLAAVMAMEPDILLLDEPGAQLDPVTYERFLHIIKQVNQDFKTTIILVEHRLAQSISLADKLVLLDQGSIVVQGSLEQVAQTVNGTDMEALLPDHIRAFVEVENQFLQIPSALGAARMWIEKKNCGKVNFLTEKNVEKSKKGDRDIAVKVSNIAYSYDFSPILKGLDLVVEKGDIMAVLGGNGAGKTTLLKVICGLLTPDSGKVKVSGKVCGVAQNPQSAFTEPTVIEELEVMCKKDRTRAEEMLGKLELTRYRDCHPYDLSGGQMQRLALGKALLLEPDILLLDEPTKGLDSISCTRIGEILKSLGITVIMVSHDIDFCAKYADKAALLFGGQIVSGGTLTEALGSNHFYTTTIGRVAGGRFPGILHREQLVDVLGGKAGVP